MSNTVFLDKPQKRRIAAQVRNIHMLIFILALALVVTLTVMVTNITDDASEKLALLHSLKAMGNFNVYVQQDLALVREASRSSAITRWFADEENQEKKAAAYKEVLDYTNTLQKANLYLCIQESLNEYSFFNEVSFEDFFPTSRLDSSYFNDAWYFECVNSEYAYNLNIDIDKVTRMPSVWINHKVMQDNNVLGVFCVGIPLQEMVESLFDDYDNKNEKGYIIDRGGYIKMDSALSDFDVEEKNEHSIFDFYSDPAFTNAMETYLNDIHGYFDMFSQPVVIKLVKNVNNYVSIVPIADTDWSVVTFYGNNFLYGIDRLLPLIMIIILVAFIVYMLVSNIIMYRLVFMPLDRLTKSLSASKFYIGEIFGCSRDDEIGVLAQTIQRMRDRLSTYNAELLRAAREREHLIRIDQLTNIPNRRSFDERLPLEWGRAIRTKMPISLLILDLDHFKNYNDSYGHLQGDKALQAAAKLFMQELKRSGDLVARWGGEEFAILLVNTDIEGALNVAEGIRRNIEALQIPLVDGSITKVTVSVGVNSLIPVSNDFLEDFIRYADMALYTAKREGRNRVCQYSKGIHFSINTANP